jgi:D-serine dehydratase
VPIGAEDHGPVDLFLDGSVKGWPDVGRPASQVKSLDLAVDDLPTPVLTLRDDVVAHNVASFAAWCVKRGVLHAPHAKTSMAPALLRRQLAAGAWGLTTADVRQARVAVACGARNVLIANEIVRSDDLNWVARAQHAHPGLRFCVDSEAGISLIERACRDTDFPVRVLLEVGYTDGRCGMRDTTDAVALAGRIAASPYLILSGVEGYEGLIGSEGPRRASARVDAFLDAVGSVAERCASMIEDAEPIITAGGSGYFDRVVDRLAGRCAALGWTLVLRSGCYVTHDHGLYAAQFEAMPGADVPSLRPAIEVRTSVLSRPQPNRVILDFGRRDVSYDAGLPTPLRTDAGGDERLEIFELNDQHAHATCSVDCQLGPGDVVTLGISHPCTALERWRLIPLIDPTGRVLDAIATYF